MSVRPRRPRDERGVASLLVGALLASGVFFGLAAFGVDTARWYVEIQRVQTAADAAALAGVPYLPYDMPNATAKAKEVAKDNGYDDAADDVEITVSKGALSSQLRVTVSRTIPNHFGQFIGVGSQKITRTAVADYKGAAPMGSPCNTFGNEPAAGTSGTTGPFSPTPSGSALAPPAVRFDNCESRPQFWATVEGPQTDKVNGDRYQNMKCNGSSTYACNSAGPGTPYPNDEYTPEGYFWVVRVEPTAVDRPINLQLYDPAYVTTGQTCGDLPTSSNIPSNNMNPFVTTDAKTRYSRSSTTPSGTGAPYCTGDFLGGTTTTSFVLRHQHDSLDPMQGAVIDGCVKQYAGISTTPTANSLRSTHSSYNEQLAKVFHNWTSLCTFTPDRPGDYYLQVRTNVSTTGGTPEPNTNGRPAIIYSGNAAAGAVEGNTEVGAGVNGFAIRAVTAAGYEQQVAVSGYDRMPIFANVPDAESSFNLIRVLPGAAGQSISFSFFDVSDISLGATGTVTVTPPDDATGSITTDPFPRGGCYAEGAGAGAGTYLTSCSAPVSNGNNNGKLERMSIPIPSDYDCDYDSLGGCWYQVTVSFPGATSVNDITTWDATIEADPVRLIE